MGRKRVAKAPGDAGGDTTGHVWDEDLAEYNNPLPRWWSWLFWITIAFGVVYLALYPGLGKVPGLLGWTSIGEYTSDAKACLLYTSDAADERSSVDLGGRR